MARARADAVLALLFVSGAVACGSASCPTEAADPAAFERAVERTASDVTECAERVAEEVCTWTAERRADHARRAADRDAAEKAEDARQPEGRVVLRHVYQLHCGCIAEPVGACFLLVSGWEQGGDLARHLVATGVPGCENARFSGALGRGIDPRRCGSRTTVRTPKASAAGLGCAG